MENPISNSVYKLALRDANAILVDGICPAAVSCKRDIVELAYMLGDQKAITSEDGKPLSRQAIADDLATALGYEPFKNAAAIWHQICNRKNAEKSLYRKYLKQIDNEQ